eukprot:3003692-Amphidinium_carterae.1
MSASKSDLRVQHNVRSRGSVLAFEVLLSSSRRDRPDLFKSLSLRPLRRPFTDTPTPWKFIVSLLSKSTCTVARRAIDTMGRREPFRESHRANSCYLVSNSSNQCIAHKSTLFITDKVLKLSSRTTLRKKGFGNAGMNDVFSAAAFLRSGLEPHRAGSSP